MAFLMIVCNGYAESSIPILDNNEESIFKPYSREVESTYHIKLKERSDLPDGIRPKDYGHFWYALPRDTSTQKIQSISHINPSPTTISTDIHGNQIAYWKFEEQRDFEVTISFMMKTNNILIEINPDNVTKYDKESSEYKLYTRSERLIAITDEVNKIASEIKKTSSNPNNPYLLAKDVFYWVMDHMLYALVPSLNRERGVTHILANPFNINKRVYYKGDCGSYSFLYNSILRALGIPARMVVGGWSFATNQHHAWSEILIPGFGWIPVDVSAADVFRYDEGEEINKLGRKSFNVFPQIKDPIYFYGNIDPYRFVDSIGSDFELTPKLDWDFSPYLYKWVYDQGIAGIIQSGIYHILLEEDLQHSFVVVGE